MNAQQKDRALWQCIATHQGQASDRFALKHARTLRRAQMTLRRWAEEMCNGTIQRTWDDTTGDQTGTPHRWSNGDRFAPRDLGPIPDRERGALARVEKVCKEAGLYYYHQTDPRGCALYVGTEPLTCQNYSSKGVPCL